MSLPAYLTPFAVAKQAGAKIADPHGLLRGADKRMPANQRAVAVKRGLLHALKGPTPNNADNNPLYNPLQILSGSDLQKAVAQIVSSQVKPQLDDIAATHKQDLSDASELSGRAADYAKFLAQQGQQGVTNQQGINADLQAALKSAGDQTQAAIGGVGSAATGDLATAGAGDAASKVAAILAAQRNEAAARAGAATGAGASQGYNMESLANNLNSAATLSGSEDQRNISYNLQKQLGDLASARKKVTDTIPGLTSDSLIKLRDEGYQQFATNEGLGIKQSQLAAATKQAMVRLGIEQQNANTSATNAQTSQTNADTSANSLTERQRHDAAQEQLARKRLTQTGSGGWNGLSPSQKRSIEQANGKIRDRIESAMTDATNLPTKDGKGNPLPKGYWTHDRVIQALSSRYKGPYAHLVAVAALDRNQNGGYLSPTVAHLLRQNGIGVPPEWVNSAAGQPRT